MSLRSTRLLRKNEAGTNPDTGSSEHQRSSKRVAIIETTSRNNLHGLASERADLALAKLGNSRDENCCRNVSSVTATFTTLSANNIRADFDSLLYVLGVANHVHVENSMLVKPVNDSLGRDTDGGDEELGAALDNDIDEFVQLAFCVVIANN